MPALLTPLDNTDQQGPMPEVVGCSRWDELSQTIRFHAGLAEAAGTPLEFRLLNGADPVMCGLRNDNGEEHKFLLDLLDDEPAGQTPLCAQIRVIVENIKSIESELRDRHKRAAVIIATDGESTDGDVARALKPLEKLPVWLVIRLCTDEDKVQVCSMWRMVACLILTGEHMTIGHYNNSHE
jgi:hypothetical protein